MTKNKPLVSIITPVYNDKEFILKTLQKFEQLQLPGMRKEIIFVDDFSTDGSRQILKKLQKKYKKKYKFIFHKKNLGLGMALKSGFKLAKGNYIVRQDVDLEYDVLDIYYLLKPLLKNQADIVYGSRTLNNNNKYSTISYYLGGHLLNFIFNLLYFNNISDFITASKLFKKEVIDSIEIESYGFEVESELTAKALKLGYKIINLPIAFKPRNFKQGKKIRWHHAFRIIKSLIYYRFA